MTERQRFEGLSHETTPCEKPCEDPRVGDWVENERHIQWAVRASRIGTWINYLDEGRVVWSEELFDIFGLKPTEFPGTEAAFFELIHPEDRPALAEVVTNAREYCGEYDVEFRYLRKGETRWMFARGRAIQGPDGRTSRLAGIGIDITERKRASLRLETIHQLGAALAQAETRERIFEHAMEALEKVLDAQRASILLLDADGVMRFKASKGLSSGYMKAVEGHSPWSPDELAPVPITIDSVEAAKLGDLKKVILKEGIRSLGFFPLVSEGKLIGKFMVYFDRERTLTQEEIDVAQVIAGHIALAVQQDDHHQKLRASQEEANRRLEEIQTLMDILPVGLYIAHDPEGRHITGNRISLDLLEARDKGANLSLSAPAPHAPTNFRVFRDGEELEADELPVQVAARTGLEVRDQELEIVFEDGRVKNELVTAIPLFDEDGKSRGAIATVVDFTERRKNEEALRVSEEQMRIVTDTMLAPVARCSKDLTYLWVSKAYCDWIGKSSEEVVGKPIHEVLGAQGARQLQPYFDQVLSGHPVHYEANVPFASLGSRWIEARYTPTYDSGGHVDGWVAIILDISHRKAAEETIRSLLRIGERLSSTLNLEELFQHLVDETLELVQAESGVAGLYTPHGMTCMQFIRKGRVEPFEYSWPPGHGLPGHILETKAPYLTNNAQNDPYVVAEVRDKFEIRSALSIPILDSQGSILGFFQVHNKVRDEAFTQADQDLLLSVSHAAAIAIQNALAYRQIQEADRKKDEFLATLAHELRNPLAPIRNAIQLLKMKGESDPQLTQSRDIIDRQVTHMTRLVDDLMDVSRITRGRIQLRMERVALQDVLRSAVETVRPSLDRAGHKLEVEAPEDLVEVEGDPVRLSQIVSNLLHNAVKYTEDGGAISIKLERQGGQAVIAVSDTGIGIRPERLPHVFEMFSQEDPAISRSQEGLGIGLALVHGLVQLHGGSVEARSEGLGLGSEFIVRLPVVLPAPLKVEGRWREGSVKAGSHRRRVLVVDDNQDHAESLGQLLQLDGHEIFLAGDGEEAVRQAAAVRPDVILLDIGMPKLNGYESARLIREKPWGRMVTLVALTGWGQEEDKQRAKDAGFDYHLTKPIDGALLDSLFANLAR